MRVWLRSSGYLLKLKQHSPSTSSGTLSASACGFVVSPCSCELANPYVPTSSRRLAPLAGFPTSAAFTAMVSVHGELGEGVAGQDTLPASWEPPKPGSGYVSTCGSHAEIEHRSTLWVRPA